MPLARIITRAVEDSLELTMQLRARGFQVETVGPDQIPPTPADLEVNLEECDSGQVVTRAAVANPGEDLWVFVAPGALDERARPMRVISLYPQIEQDVFPKSTKVAPATVLPFPAPEDDPILLDLESDLILAESARFEAAAADRTLETASPSLPNNGAAQAGLLPRATSAKATSVTIAKREEHRDEFHIPQVPERPVVRLNAGPVAVPRKRRDSGFRVNFKVGPRFWRTLWASSALAMLVGVLGVILGMRASSPVPFVPTATGQSQLPLAVESVRPAQNPKAAPKPPSPPQHSHSSFVLTQAATRPAVPQTQKRVPRARPSHVDDIVAEDTVVFYNRSHGRPVSKSPPPAQYRKYTDLN